MPSRLLFISDLHLESARPDISATLLQFLADNTGRCDALYILGDLFEVWIGDDESSDLANRIAAALHAFAEGGAAIYLMHGNRDFLIGEAFARRCGATLLPDPSIITSPIGPVLLSHGDQLCTDDVDYMGFREMVRQPAWQAEFLSRSLSERRNFAQQARQQSTAATQDKAQQIMDVNQQAVLGLLRETSQSTLIHGHTHRPQTHNIALDTPIAGCNEAWRVVLGDWHTQGWNAEITAAGINLQRFPLRRAS